MRGHHTLSDLERASSRLQRAEDEEVERPLRLIFAVVSHRYL
jgi:hypothetical protein